MLTSARQTKTAYTRQFLGAILGICLLTACSAGDPGVRPAESSETPVPAETAVSEDWSEYAGHKVHVPAGTSILTETGEQAGMFPADAEIDISADASGKYLNINDSRYAVDGAEIQQSSRWMKHETALQPIGKQVTTADTYHLQDLSGKETAEIHGADTYEVYAEPCADDPRYGVRFNGRLAYIPQEETVSCSGERTAQGAVNLPVLMYHFFYSEADGGVRENANFVEVNELDEQLDWLQQSGYSTLTMEETLCYMQGRSVIPSKSVVITIDDGDPSVHQYAYNVIRDHGMHATLFLITGWGGQNLQNYDFWEMREDGLELQSHGFLTHQGGCSGMGHGGRILCMDHAEGVEDTRMSFDAVDGGFVYCYPFGDYNDSAKAIISEAGAKLAFTTEYGKIDPSMDLLALPRIRVQGGAGIERYISSIED